MEMPKPDLDSYVVTVRVPRPSLDNNTADADRLKQALAGILNSNRIRIPLALLKTLPSVCRQNDFGLTVVVFREKDGFIVAGIRGQAPDGQGGTSIIAGVAMDIGTTRVVLRLMNLETGDILGEQSFDNPQVRIAPDVLARIHHAGNPDGLAELQSLIIQAVNEHIDRLTRNCGLTPDHVYLVAGAGNTAMTHLFMGIDPGQIIKEPYIPCMNIPETLPAADLGLDIHCSGQVFLFPNIGSYFGGDLLAGILFSRLYERDNPCILVDVGTNAEIAVGNREWLLACAGAAGPALEGGVSKMGMAAKPGVIDKIRIDPGTLEIDIHTIDGRPPVGICGSGMIDLAAQLFLSGMIDIRGKFSPAKCGRRLVDRDGISTFILVEKTRSGTGEDILFSQIDLNSLTSSKAAMYTILEVIVRQTAGIGFEDLETFFVAGTFGSFIDPQSAISIGMLPDIPVERFTVLGNSSLGGAAMMLSDPSAYDRVMEIRRGITYIELNVNQSFMNMFSGAKFYPHTDRSRFPSVHFD